MEVVVMGVPFGEGAGVPGSEDAPDALRRLGVIQRIGKYGQVRDMGNLVIGPKNPAWDLKNEKISNFDKVIETNRIVTNMAIKYAEDEDFTLFLGGDHSISAGSILGRLSCYPDTAVIWMDAHADLNTHVTSPSGNAHGMSAASLLWLGEAVPQTILPSTNLPKNSIFMLGQRESALDHGEINFINEAGIYIRTWAGMRHAGIVNTLEDVFENVRKIGASRVHLSFDIDLLSAELVPATGTPVPGGPDVFNTKLMLRALAESGLLRSMDFVEYNPSLDENDATGKLCVELLEEVFANLR